MQPDSPCTKKRWLPLLCLPASECHAPQSSFPEYQLRIPSEPEPFPIQEPPDSPENPDIPVREPDPEDPGQI